MAMARFCKQRRRCGVALVPVPAFVGAQLGGALLGTWVARRVL